MTKIIQQELAMHLLIIEDGLEDISAEYANECLNLKQIRQSLNPSNLRSKSQLARQVLYKLRERINTPNIHDALLFLASTFPLNTRDKQGHLLCPITGTRVNQDTQITLTNGCLYNKNDLLAYSSHHSAFPRKLPGSPHEVDQQDAESLHKPLQTSIINRNLFAGAYINLALLFPIALLKLLGVLSVPTLGTALALALGVSSAMGFGLTLGIGVLVVALPFIITAIATVIYVRAKYPLELSSKATASLEKEKNDCSTAISFSKLAIHPDASQLTPASLSAKAKIIKLFPSGINTQLELSQKIPPTNSQQSTAPYKLISF